MSIDNIPILFIDPRSKTYIEENETINFGKKITTVFSYLTNLFQSPLDVTLILGNKIYYYSNTAKELKEDYKDIPNTIGYISDNTGLYIEKIKEFIKNKTESNLEVLVLSNIFLSYDANEILSAEKIKLLLNALKKENANVCVYNDLLFFPGDEEFINDLSNNQIEYLSDIDWNSYKKCATNLYKIISNKLHNKLETNI